MLVCRLVVGIRDKCIRVVLRNWRRRLGWAVVVVVRKVDISKDIIVMGVDAIMDMEVTKALKLTHHLKTNNNTPTIPLKDLVADTDILPTPCFPSPTPSSRSNNTRLHQPSSHSPSTNP
jgi:hypothetical protein